jgi:gamma-glutamylcyclotransferase (GGCT)/AIG2-like uncharacterized protein YtfP
VTGEALFTYGTLMCPEVLAAVAGATGAARPARLPGYVRRRVRGAVWPGILRRPGASVEGVLWSGLGAAALARLDRYEGAAFRREAVIVATAEGEVPAHAYILAARHRWRLTKHDWAPEAFRARHLADTLARLAGG